MSSLAVEACTALGLLPSVHFRACLRKGLLRYCDDKFESSLNVEAGLDVFATMVIVVAPGGKVEENMHSRAYCIFSANLALQIAWPINRKTHDYMCLVRSSQFYLSLANT